MYVNTTNINIQILIYTHIHILTMNNYVHTYSINFIHTIKYS